MAVSAPATDVAAPRKPAAAKKKRLQGWRGVHPGILAGVFFVLFALLVYALNHGSLPALTISENVTTDWIATYFEPRRPTKSLSETPELPHEQIVVLAITENTLAQFPYRFPIDRQFLAKTLDLLAARKVKAVALDVLFDQPTVAEADAAFRDAAKRFPAPLIVGWADTSAGLSDRQYNFQREYLRDIRAGFVNMIRDSTDGVVRDALPGLPEGDGWRPSFAGAIAEAVGVAPPRERFRIRYVKGADEAKPAFPIQQVQQLEKLPAAWFKDRIVIIGADLPHDDRHRTPFAIVTDDTTPGTLIQAQIVGQLLDGTPSKVRNYAVEILVTFALAGLALLLAAWERGVAVQALAGVGVIVMLWTGSVLLYKRADIIQPVVAPSLVFGIGLFAAVAYIGHLRRLEGQFVRDAFSHYVSPAVLTDVESSGLQLGGEKREISVLFTDIEGFTTFAEKQEPQVLIEVVNRYLTVMTGEVYRYGGTVDKFIGDAVMAIFNAPILQPDHAKRAIDCALAMRDVSEKLRTELRAEGFELGRTRIGVHSGFAVVGNVGGETKFNYTAVGDVVNTASRLEGANKHFGTQLCFSEDTCRLAGFEQTRPIGALVVKGRTEGLPVVTPVTADEALQTASYFDAYAIMRKGELDAIGAFVEHCKKWPEDKLAAFHLTRLKTFKIDDKIVLEGK